MQKICVIVQIRTPNFMYVFIFKRISYLSCIQVIQEAIDEFQKKNETFKMASKELSVEEPVSSVTFIWEKILSEGGLVYS